MEPGADRIAAPNRFGLANQDQKGCLKRIVGLVRVANQAAAQAQNHRTVPFDQNAKRFVTKRIMAGLKTLQELAVG